MSRFLDWIKSYWIDSNYNVRMNLERPSYSNTDNDNIDQTYENDDEDFDGIISRNSMDINLNERPKEIKQQNESVESNWKKFKKRIPYYIPILSWLPSYNIKRDLANDIVASLGVTAMLVPQSLAYAALAGVPPENGLYTACFPLLMYCILGTSRQVSIGPDALTSLLIGIILSNHVMNVDTSILFPLYSFITGILLLLFGFIRIGFLDNILSKPLLTGFINAVSIVIILEQIDTFFGIPNEGSHGIHKFSNLWKYKSIISWKTFGLGLICVSLLLLNKFLKKRHLVFKYIPDTLVVVLLGILLMKTTPLKSSEIEVLGKLKNGFIKPSAPAASLISKKGGEMLLYDTLILCIIGFMEHIVTCRIYASRHQYSVSSNRELVAIGASNLFGSFFKTYPTFGSITRSGVADSLSAKTQLYSFFSFLLMLFVIGVLGPIFSDLPRVVMSSIIIVASINLFHFDDIMFLWKVRAIQELSLCLLTFVSTLFLGVELGIFISLGISIGLIIKKSSYPNITILGNVPGTSEYFEISRVDSKSLPGILIVRIEEALYFANIKQIKSLFTRIETLGDPKAHPAGETDSYLPELKALIIHSRNILTIDASAIQVLHEMVIEYEKRNIFVAFVKLRPNLLEAFKRIGIIKENCEYENVFWNLDDAVTHAKKKISEEEENNQLNLMEE